MTDTAVQTLDAIRSFLHLQRQQFERTHTTAGIWSEAWNEAWGGQQTLNRLENILDTGTWNGEVYAPSE